MENIADALKIAGAVLIFIIAITITFSVISQAKQTSDKVIEYTYETSLYTYQKSKELNREVGVDTVISTLYRYYKESFGVKIKLETDEKEFDLKNNNSFSSTEELEKDLATFIKEKLLSYKDKKFKEEFDEVVVNGEYCINEDGSEVVLTKGSTRIYITYTVIM